MKPPRAPAGFKYIFVRSFRHKKTGRRIYAASFGKQAFRLLVRDK
jgi:hypothetical protein